MTHLRKAMLEELQRRNLSAITTRIYLHSVEEFAQYFKTPPDRLGLEPIRQYQAHLFTDRQLEAVSVAQQLSALRFFFLKILKRPWQADDMPVSQTADSPAQGPLAERSRTSNPIRRQPPASNLAARPLCHRHPSRRISSVEGQRH